MMYQKELFFFFLFSSMAIACQLPPPVLTLQVNSQMKFNICSQITSADTASEVTSRIQC